MGGKASAGVQGFKYLMGTLVGLCRGALDEIVQMKAGDIVGWTGPISGAGSAIIYQPQLFGGDEAEGGLFGTFSYFDGNPQQEFPALLKQIISATNQIVVATTDGSLPIPLPAVDSSAESTTTDTAPRVGSGTIPTVFVPEPVPVPEFRGVSTLWYYGQVSSNNPYVKPMKWRVRRALAGWEGDAWYPEKAMIALLDPFALAQAATDTVTTTTATAGTTNTTPATTAVLLPESGLIKAMNGAHIIYQVATDRTQGRGLDRIMIDDDSFTSAANRLYDEQFGLCLKWNRAGDIGDFIQTVCDHIGAFCYTDRQTGLLTLRLVRADYAIDELPVFDKQSGLLTVRDATNSSSDTLANEVVVKYHSAISDTDRSVRAQSLAGMQSQGRISVTKEYLGLPTPNLAMRVAQRDLAAQALGLGKYELTFDRRGFKIAPGACFIVNAPDEKISGIVLRCIQFDDSTLTDGHVRVIAVEDVFALPLETFATPQRPLFAPPSRDPIAVSYHRLCEATYRDAYKTLSAVDLAALDSTQTAIQDLAAAPTSLANGFLLATGTDGVDFDTTGIKQFTTYGRLSSAIGLFDSSITLTGVPDTTVINLPICVLIDDEFVRIDAIDLTTGIATIARGCVDSIPAKHAAGAVAWFYDTGANDAREYIVGETVTAYEQTRTSLGLLPAANAFKHTILLAGRQARPYPPNNVTINGPWVADGYVVTAADLVVNWSRRNRATLADQMLGYGDADQTPEAGQTTTVRVRKSDGTIARTVTGLTGTTYTYTQANAISDGASGAIQIELYSERGGLTSKWANIYALTYYPAAAAGAIGLGAFHLTASETAQARITGTHTASFAIVELAEFGTLPVTADAMSSAFSFRASNYGTTLGGIYHVAGFEFGAAQSASVPAAGGMHATLLLRGTPAPGSFGMLFLTSAATGGVEDHATDTGAFLLTSSASGAITVSGAGLAAFQIFSSKTGVVGGATAEEGGVENHGALSSAFALTSFLTSSASAQALMSAAFALQASAAGTVSDSGTESRGFLLTSAESGTVSITGTSSASFQLTSNDAAAVTVQVAMAGAFRLTAVETAAATVTATLSTGFVFTSSANGVSAGYGFDYGNAYGI